MNSKALIGQREILIRSYFAMVFNVVEENVVYVITRYASPKSCLKGVKNTA